MKELDDYFLPFQPLFVLIPEKLICCYSETFSNFNKTKKKQKNNNFQSEIRIT